MRARPASHAALAGGWNAAVWLAEPQHGRHLCLHASQGVDTARAAGAEWGPVLLLDTAGCGMEEAADEGSDSRRNEGEARVALAHAQRLLDLGLRAEDVGIITPYSAQVGPAACMPCCATHAAA